jgi:uncharacterized protein YceK
MRQLAPVVFAALAALLLSGCGTICNFAAGIEHPDEAPTVYGGFRFDMKVCEAVATTDNSLGITHGSAYTVLFILGLACADPLLSLAGDTVTLPYTLYLERRRAKVHARDHDGQSPIAPGGSQTDQEAWSSALPSRPTIDPGWLSPTAIPAAVPAAQPTPSMPAPSLPPTDPGQSWHNNLWPRLLPAVTETNDNKS